MAITVGVDTYASLSFLNTYIGLDMYARTDWQALEDTDKEIYAKAATQLIDKLDWIGSQTDATQVLKFPRDFSTYVSDPARAPNYFEYSNSYVQNPYYKNTGSIFDDLKKAQAEIIISLLIEPETDDHRELKGLKKIGVESFSVDVISFKFNSMAGDNLPLPEKAYNLLKDYLLRYTDILRIERG